MPWPSGKLFEKHLREGVGRVAPGEPSGQYWEWQEFKKSYERCRHELLKTNDWQPIPEFPRDNDTTRCWIEGETRVQRRYRPVLLAVFYGVGRARDDDTELAQAWHRDDQALRRQPRRAAPGGRDHSAAPAEQASPDQSAPIAHGNWQGGNPPLPVERIAAAEVLIDTVRAKLRIAGQAPACVLWGQPGVGKSTLAALIAPRIAPDPQCPLYWVKFHPDGFHDLEDRTTPIAALQGLASTLSRIVPPDASREALISEIQDALSGKPYVLVCDNVRDESEFASYDLRSRTGLVLATSLSPSWEHIQHLEIKLWARQTCRDYIRLRIPQRIPPIAPNSVLDSLARTIGYLPLGLAQSTAYIRSARITIEEYIARFEANTKKLLGERQPPEEGSGPAFKTIRSTCYMLFDLIREDAEAPGRHDAPLRLLCVMSILGRAGASRAFLLNIFAGLFGPGAEDLLDRAVMRLGDLSLISEGAGGSEILLHQMTYVAVRCWIEEKFAEGKTQLAAHIKKTFGCTRRALRGELREDAATQTRLLAVHAESLLRLTEIADAECAGPERWDLLQALAAALAEAFGGRELRPSIAYVCELAAKESDPKLKLFCEGVRLAIKSGSALGEGELQDCERGLTDILQQYPALCSGEQDWRRVAYFQRSLSGTRFDLGDLDGTLAAIDGSLATLAETQDRSSIDVIRSHGARGRALDALGRCEEAVEEYQTALAIFEPLDDRDFLLNREEVELRYCMADVLLRLDRVAEAADHLEWAQRRAEELPYPRIDQGSIKNSFGQALMFQGRIKESMKWLRQGRYAVGKRYGHDHAAYARQLLDLAALMGISAVLAHPDLKPSARQLRAVGRLATQALKISESVKGARRYVFASLMSLSTYLIHCRAYSEAIARLASASEVLQDIARDSGRAADVREPALRRAEAVAFAGMADYAQALQQLAALSVHRSRALLPNRGERARDKCVEAQVLFAAGRLNAAEASQMLAAAAEELSFLHGSASPLAQIASRLSGRFQKADTPAHLRGDVVIV